jgi:hypothetical protein
MFPSLSFIVSFPHPFFLPASSAGEARVEEVSHLLYIVEVVGFILVEHYGGAMPMRVWSPNLESAGSWLVAVLLISMLHGAPVDGARDGVRWMLYTPL